MQALPDEDIEGSWATVPHTPGLQYRTPLGYVPYAPGLQYRMPLGYSTACPRATVPYAPGLQYHMPLGYSTAYPWATVPHAPGRQYCMLSGLSHCITQWPVYQGGLNTLFPSLRWAPAPIILGLTTFLHFYIGVERGTKGLIPGYKNCSYTTGMC